MTHPPTELDRQSQRYPLSFAQEWFCTLDQGDDGGAFGSRFISSCPLRITGHVDTAILQAALNDVVARHELLRTLVIRDADPPYQLVRPPCPVPLEVSEVPAPPGKPRDMMAQEFISEVGRRTVSAREVPLLRAALRRFDDQDSVLVLTAHHSASDGWSVMVIARDLGAFYAARIAGTPAKLAPVRQYREYSEWQKANATSLTEDSRPAYWLSKLRGAREFTMPTDRPHPDVYSRPYSLHVYAVDASDITAVSALATATRTSQFMITLSALYVLAHHITGATDLTIRALTAGRDDPQFQDTMGLFINLVPFRTDISDCVTFRDIVERTRETCIDAYAHELPINVIEQTIPDFTTSRDNSRTAQFCLANFQSQFGDITIPIADGAHVIHEHLNQEDEQADAAQGMVWTLDMRPSGDLGGSVMYNLDEWDPATVTNWAAIYRRILTTAIRHPDTNWRAL